MILITDLSPISLISKITGKKSLKCRLLVHLSCKSLLKPFQFAYTKNYSIETKIISLYDHLSNTISHQQVSCLCLLDLSAASIPLFTLSYFIVSLVSSALFLFLFSDSPHICRLAHLLLPFHPVALPLPL